MGFIMKRVISAILTVIMLISFVACARSSFGANDNPPMLIAAVNCCGI